MKIARIYLRVSTIEQSNQRQEKIIDEATNNGYEPTRLFRRQFILSHATLAGSSSWR